MTRTDAYLFESDIGWHLFASDGSRIYDIPSDAVEAVQDRFDDKSLSDSEILNALGVAHWAQKSLSEAPAAMPVRAVSLNIAQSCNLGCAYCYAGEGRFGGPAKVMDRGIAEQSVNFVLGQLQPGSRCTIGFMGGEPLLNRALLHHVVQYAEQKSKGTGIDIGFSLTTNATLLTDEDAALFRDHRFSVQFSLDGDRSDNDRHRPQRSGGGSYERVAAALETVDRIGRPRHLSARATITRDVNNLAERLDHLIGMGFDDVGFAPVLAAPDADLEHDAASLEHFTESMLQCGERALGHLLEGRGYPFSNLETALYQIHRGAHRPYPCGAGASYMSVDADGDLFSCHRSVNQDGQRLGRIAAGVNAKAQTRHLARRHVDRQDPCKSCWARYMCGGGCYHEVDMRGRPSCEYIRSWLAFCLKAYVELQTRRPQYFDEIGTMS